MYLYFMFLSLFCVSTLAHVILRLDVDDFGFVHNNYSYFDLFCLTLTVYVPLLYTTPAHSTNQDGQIILTPIDIINYIIESDACKQDVPIYYLYTLSTSARQYYDEYCYNVINTNICFSKYLSYTTSTLEKSNTIIDTLLPVNNLTAIEAFEEITQSFILDLLRLTDLL